MVYYIDDLEPGMSESFTKLVSERDVELFGEVSGDVNPVHFDEDFARKTMFRGRVAHGVLTLSILSAVMGMKMPGPGSAVLNFTIAFKTPVRIGDVVTATCTVLEKVGKRQVLFGCLCKVGDTVVAEGEALVMPPLKSR